MKNIISVIYNRIKELFAEIKSESGITLIEMIIAITIIAILGIVAVTAAIGNPAKSKGNCR